MIRILCQSCFTYFDAQASIVSRGKRYRRKHCSRECSSLMRPKAPAKALAFDRAAIVNDIGEPEPWFVGAMA